MSLDRIAVFLGAARFMPHAMCLGNDPWIIGLFVATHILVGIAYMIISGVLFFDRAAATRAMFDNRMAFGAFIVLCGLSHFSAAVTFYAAVYWLEAAIMLATCIVSATVAWVTLRTLRTKRAAPA
jgi:hypothetical protein